MNELNRKIKEYKRFYQDNDYQKEIFHIITKHPNKIILKSIICSIKYRYYKNKDKGIINKIKMIYYGRKNNINAMKYGLEIYGHIGERCKIYHNNIVINNNAIIGDNVKLHGNNCIGNNGKNHFAPKIGNNVDIGYGAVIIGDITIADNIKIGANSIVTKSFTEPGIVIAGNPAKKIKD